MHPEMQEEGRPSASELDASMHPDATASRAEPPPPLRSRRFIGAFVLAVVALGLGLKLLGERPSNVPDGIGGLRFGMSPAEARQTVSSVEDLPPSTLPTTDPSEELPHLRGRAPVFDEPATCTLWFAVAGGLSKIQCALDPLPSRDSTDRVSQRILVTLRNLFGEERRTGADGAYYLWQNDRASLQLMMPRQSASIVITNTLRDHDGAVARLTAASAEKAKLDEVLEEREALKERLEELKKLQREQQGLDSDGGSSD